MGYPMVVIQFSSPKSGQPLYSGQIAGPNVSFRQRFHSIYIVYVMYIRMYTYVLVLYMYV